MAEEGDYRFQLSLKLGQDMLNIRGNTFEVFLADVQLAKQSVDSNIARFFPQNDTGLGAKSDTAKAAAKVQETFPGSTVEPETPNCPVCGGVSKGKQVNTKYGERTFYECQQKKGKCVNDKGYANGSWKSQAKGRDS